jgi:hypothetical protein
VATVDPGDDDIERYVVRHYAHDPERHERRHQVIAAFDNEGEFVKLLKRLNADPAGTGRGSAPGHRRCEASEVHRR